MAARSRDKKPNRDRPRAAAARAGTPRAWWAIALIAAAGAIVYVNSLANPFLFDDIVTIADNPQIRSLSSVFHTDKGSALTGRPVASLTFALNYAFDGVNVTGYRAVNVALHVLCGLLLFGVIRRACDRPALRERWGRRATGLALAAALLWVVHPLTTEVVNYVTQRTESLMALCYLLALYASVRALDAQRSGAWQGLAVAACALGMLCKEPMGTAPLMIAIFDRVFAFDSFAAAWRARWRLYGGLAAAWIVLAMGVATASRELSGGFATTHVSAWSYLLNQTRVVTHYLTLVVWPKALVVYYGWSLPVTLADVWPYAACLTALFLASVAALVRWPRVGYLPIWFFVTLAPSSSVLPIAAEVGADRRMYVPLMGLVVLAVVAATWLLDWLSRPGDGRAAAGSRRVPFAPVALTALVVLALGAMTWARNGDYGSELRLSQTTLAHWPSAVSRDMVGLSLARLERREDAIVELRQAVADYAPARYDLGVQYYALGRWQDAIEELQRFVALEPHQFTTSAAYTLIGGALERTGRAADAIEAYRKAVSGPMPDRQAHGFLADLLLDASRHDEAIAHYQAYLAAFPERTPALINLGIAYASAHKTEEALAAFRRAVERDVSNRQARLNLTQMLLEAGRFEAAVSEARQLITLAPTAAIGYDLLGQALASQRNLPEARRAFEQALQVDPSYAPARENLARIGR